jgi:hypothetical protein
MWLPVGLHAREGELELRFTDPLDAAAASNPGNYALKTWSLKRSAEYGSRHTNERPLAVEAAVLSEDGRTVTLKIPTLAPTWGMEIACRLKGNDGTRADRVIHNSIFSLGN